MFENIFRKFKLISVISYLSRIINNLIFGSKAIWIWKLFSTGQKRAAVHFLLTILKPASFYFLQPPLTQSVFFSKQILVYGRGKNHMVLGQLNMKGVEELQSFCRLKTAVLRVLHEQVRFLDAKWNHFFKPEGVFFWSYLLISTKPLCNSVDLLLLLPII